MGMAELKIKSVLFHVPLKPAGSLRLVLLADGTYCILKDEKLLDGHCWPQSKMAKAIAEFQEIKRQLLAGK